jgi:hypothetical protein
MNCGGGNREDVNCVVVNREVGNREDENRVVVKM